MSTNGQNIQRRTNMMKTEEQIFTNTLFEVEDLIRHNCELESHDNTGMSCQYSKAIAALNDGLKDVHKGTTGFKRKSNQEAERCAY